MMLSESLSSESQGSVNTDKDPRRFSKFGTETSSPTAAVKGSSLDKMPSSTRMTKAERVRGGGAGGRKNGNANGAGAGGAGASPAEGSTSHQAPPSKAPSLGSDMSTEGLAL